MEGIDVQNVQQRLSELGFYQGEITGRYDKQTAEAVQAYQASIDYPADGIVDPTTWQAIGLSEESQQLFDSEYNIVVDLTSKQLILKRGQQTLKRYPIAVGKSETPTPTGSWKIIQKTEDPGGAFGTRWMRLNVPWGGYGIHGTDVPESIGNAASHGCIRMLNEDVEVLYSIVPLGTAVTIIGGSYTGRLLGLGDEGDDVMDVQQKLRRLGYYSSGLDGIFDELTQTAVERFQQDYGLEVDGIVGPVTYQALNKMNDLILGDTQP